ncbi:unnamed protein product [Soboliphyme baturini]|uniref:Peptidase_S24 domain-containing protein n=1 Tax=Soboliphyme baturini TaxID=241478 RepID=A0A183IKV6_9BILA|nr:unnamed protein product [Soboliphyme baturini]
MYPTLRDGDLLLVDSLSVRLGNDVVVCVCPDKPSTFLCKRLIRFEGKDTQNHSRFSVSVYHVWLEGDNFVNSRDSRQFGAVPYSLVKSRVLCRVSTVLSTEEA